MLHLPRGMAILCLAALVLAACTSADEGPASLRVGAGSTTEQQILAAVTVELLGRHTVAAEIVPELGDTVDVRDDALDEEIDIYWDYSGAAWALALDLTAPPIDPQESFEAVAAEELENGLRWLGPSEVDARLAFFVPGQAVPSAEEATLSWLAGQLGSSAGSLCADAEYLSARSGFTYLLDTYAIAPDTTATQAAAEEEALAGTADGTCVAGLATATSGQARQLGLVPLTDDQGVFPALVLAPVVVSGGLADIPTVISLLDALAGQLTSGTLAGLNAQAAAGMPIDQVAVDFIDSVGLG
ncbi:MAG: glycine betaine ABC transporter substrate-binding protein [Euzebya sp.]